MNRQHNYFVAPEENRLKKKDLAQKDMEVWRFFHLVDGLPHGEN